MKNKKPIILVSSTVYGVEELLNLIYKLLTIMGYEVWMSHKGTMPVSSKNSAFKNCIDAVKKCDLFLGIITTQYGSGVANGELSITHQEILKAIELNKPRWILAHDQVVFARKLLSDLGYKTVKERNALTLKPKPTSISDIRVIQMYEDAIKNHVPLKERQGNWVQKFDRDYDANLFVVAQFSRYQEAEECIKENFEDQASLYLLSKEKRDD